MGPKSGKQRQKEMMDRIRADPERYASFKEIQRQRWENRKEKFKTAKMSDREHRSKKKKWREAQKKCRSKKKSISDVAVTIPGSQPAVSNCDKLPSTSAGCSAKKLLGRKKIRKDRSSAYRTIHILAVQLAAEKKRSERYKKRHQRLVIKNLIISSPEARVRNLIRGTPVNHKVRRELFFSSALISSIKQKYQFACEKGKYTITKLVTGKFKKYRLLNFSSQTLGISVRKSKRTERPSVLDSKRKQYNSAGARLGSTVANFLLRDDNSRITTSKSDTITRKGCKKQRRLLVETLSRLHKKFSDENPHCLMSYSLFCRLRPFYIVQPTMRDRESCLCKLHENSKLIIDRMTQLKMLPVELNTIENCVRSSVCEEPTKLCYERKCCMCQNKCFISADDLSSDTVNWSQWMTVKEPRIIKAKEVMLTRTVKKEVVGSRDELRTAYYKLMPKLCWHLMVLKHQFRIYHTLKENNSCVLIVDFSENFTCHRNREIQSAHFGASQQQVTLHTGVVYIGNETLSFCSISDCCRHDPSAIWAHLEPVIKHVRHLHPAIDSIHFWSDGPTTQYRNKHNFLLFSHSDRYGLKGCSWNFFEAGHGKGAADAIGGVINRCADGAINNGSEITNAETLYKLLCDRTKVKLFLITEDNISTVDNYLSLYKVNTVPGTMKIHQLIWQKHSTLRVRDLSCFCEGPLTCNCFDARLVEFAYPPCKMPVCEQVDSATAALELSATTVVTATTSTGSLGSNVVDNSTTDNTSALELSTTSVVTATTSSGNVAVNSATDNTSALELSTTSVVTATTSTGNVAVNSATDKKSRNKKQRIDNRAIGPSTRPQRVCTRKFNLAEAVRLIQADSDED